MLYLPHQKSLWLFLRWGSLVVFFLMNCTLSPPIPSPSIQYINPTKLANLLLTQQGKFVFLHFWVSYYPNAPQNLNLLQKIQNTHKESVTVIAVSLDPNGISVVKPFFEKLSLDYPVLIGDEELAKIYKVSVLPKTFIFNSKGILVEEFSGSLEWEQLLSKISLP